MSTSGPPPAPRPGPGPATVRAWLDRACEVLAEAQVPTPRADAELLAGHVLGLGRGEVAAAVVTGRRLDDDARARLDALLDERRARVPLQHLTGTADFRTLTLAVGPGVFVPRPETEVVAGHAIEAVDAAARVRGGAVTGPVRVVDLCTGSGAIALSVAVERPGTEVTAVEADPLAVAWARRNVEALAPGVRLLEADAGDLAGTPLARWTGLVDVVVSNPPYIPPGMVPRDPEVRRHDPPAALYGGGEDGLAVPARVVRTAARLLRPGGVLVMEHGDDQGPGARALCADGGWADVRTVTDLTGRDRALVARRAPDGPEGVR